MPAIATFGISDGEPTPVSHTFVPNGIDPGGLALWINRNLTVPSASETLTHLVKPSPADPGDYQIPGKKVAPRKNELRLKMPVTYVDSGTGLTLVDFVNESHTVFLQHPRTTKQQADNLRELTRNAIGQSQHISGIEDGERFY